MHPVLMTLCRGCAESKKGGELEHKERSHILKRKRSMSAAKWDSCFLSQNNPSLNVARCGQSAHPRCREALHMPHSWHARCFETNLEICFPAREKRQAVSTVLSCRAVYCVLSCRAVSVINPLLVLFLWRVGRLLFCLLLSQWGDDLRAEGERFWGNGIQRQLIWAVGPARFGGLKGHLSVQVHRRKLIRLQYYEKQSYPISSAKKLMQWEWTISNFSANQIKIKTKCSND